MVKNKIRVLIADDSPLVREILKDMIEGEPDMEVAGEAVHGREAVRLTEALKPDIITMDVLMPVMNGIEATEEIMAYHPTPILVFSSAVSDKEMDVAFQSIARGALDVLEKPKVPSGEQYDRVRQDLVNKLRILSRIQVIPHIRGKRNKRTGLAAPITAPGPKTAAPPVSRIGPGPGLKPAAIPEPKVPVRPPVEIVEQAHDLPAPGLIEVPAPHLVRRKLVVVGSSTGGPKALVQIFSRLPAGFPLPILAVQHIAHSFAPGLVAWLGRESALRVLLAEDRMTPEPGTVYISPTGVHMIVEAGLIRLTDSAPVNSCKPSVDILFESVAPQMGPVTVGVLLTGMGRDGARGLKHIRDQRGRTIVQDQSTSVIFGMPKAAIEIGAAEEIAPLHLIPETIVKAIIH